MGQRTVLKPEQIYDVSLVYTDKATQRDPDAVIEVVKAKSMANTETAAAPNNQDATVGTTISNPPETLPTAAPSLSSSPNPQGGTREATPITDQQGLNAEHATMAATAYSSVDAGTPVHPGEVALDPANPRMENPITAQPGLNPDGNPGNQGLPSVANVHSTVEGQPVAVKPVTLDPTTTRTATTDLAQTGVGENGAEGLGTGTESKATMPASNYSSVDAGTAISPDAVRLDPNSHRALDPITNQQGLGADGNPLAEGTIATTPAPVSFANGQAAPVSLQAGIDADGNPSTEGSVVQSTYQSINSGEAIHPGTVSLDPNNARSLTPVTAQAGVGAQGAMFEKAGDIKKDDMGGGDYACAVKQCSGQMACACGMTNSDHSVACACAANPDSKKAKKARKAARRAAKADAIGAPAGVIASDADDKKKKKKNDDNDEDDDVSAAKVKKAEFTADERKKLAKRGAALPDGSFPIRNGDDLGNAMHAFGRANPSKRAAVKNHIRRRAAALGLTGSLTPAFKAEQITEEELTLQAIVDVLDVAAEPVNDYVATLEEINKAGAVFSKKNKGVLHKVWDAIGKLLNEESKEPDHADISQSLHDAATMLTSSEKASDATHEEEEDDMGFTLEELQQTVEKAMAPLSQRLEALEKAEPVVVAPAAAPVETPVVATQKAETYISQTELDDAMALWEARRMKGLTPSGAGTGRFPVMGTPGLSELKEIGKARPLEQRPTLEEGLRILTKRDIVYGTLPRDE